MQREDAAAVCGAGAEEGAGGVHQRGLELGQHPILQQQGDLRRDRRSNSGELVFRPLL